VVVVVGEVGVGVEVEVDVKDNVTLIIKDGLTAGG